MDEARSLPGLPLRALWCQRTHPPLCRAPNLSAGAGSLRDLRDRGAAPAAGRLRRPLSTEDGPLLGLAAVPGLLKVTGNHRRGKKKMKG